MIEAASNRTLAKPCWCASFVRGVEHAQMLGRALRNHLAALLFPGSEKSLRCRRTDDLFGTPRNPHSLHHYRSATYCEQSIFVLDAKRVLPARVAVEKLLGVDIEHTGQIVDACYMQAYCAQRNQ